MYIRTYFFELLTKKKQNKKQKKQTDQKQTNKQNK